MKKTRKSITKFTKTSIGLGAGSTVLAGMSAKSGVSVGGGLSNVGGMMPMVGTTMMGGNALRMVSKFGKKKRKKK